MAKIKAEGCKTVYFSTGTNSAKTEHYRKNPKAGVTYCDGGDSVTLLGKIKIVEDKKLKDALWQDWFIKHFPQGKDDPSYAILRFDAEEATIYIKDKFETVKL
jgi:general stress protein 26